MVERLIKVRHLIRYIREVNYGEEFAPIVDRIITGVAAQFEYKLTINYILRGPFDDQYQSKRQQKKLLRAATVKAQVIIVHARGSWEETKPIDGPISFPLVNPNKVIVPHYCICGFDVHRVLVYPSNAVNLLQLLAFN